MTEFVGRTGALRVYSYPTTPRAGVGPQGYARNFASGPADDTAIAEDPGTAVPWHTVDAGAGPDIPITPKVTGIIRISGVLTIEGGGEGASDIQVIVQIDSGSGFVTQAAPSQNAPLFEFNTVGNTETEAVPFEAEIKGLTIGTTVQVRILLIATHVGTVLSQESSTIEVQEVTAATG
jgi:hypothetical protein